MTLPEKMIVHRPFTVSPLTDGSGKGNGHFVLRVADEHSFSTTYTVVSRDELYMIYTHLATLLTEDAVNGGILPNE
jgi:hypothetical protein